MARLQRLLLGAGYHPGPIDGTLGPMTGAAMAAFQEARGLTVDGVCGPLTWSALEPGLAASASGWRAERVCLIFPCTPRRHIEQHLPHVLAGLREFGIDDTTTTLVALATIRAETETFLPVAEAPSRWNTTPGGHPFDRYDGRGDLGNAGRPDGEFYRGRGFVQLTGRSNYARIGHLLGLAGDLVQEPDRALDPATAGRILAAYLLRCRGEMTRALAAGDLVTARRLVNGGRHGLERFSDAWRRGVDLLGRAALDRPVGTD